MYISALSGDVNSKALMGYVKYSTIAERVILTLIKYPENSILANIKRKVLKRTLYY
jgi:hypothetical protein